MNTCSLLLRLSGKAKDASTGLVQQEKDLRAKAALHGLTVIAVHVDNGKSGALRKRPGLLAWLDDGKSGRATHLLADKIDRVSRGGIAALAAFLDVIEGVNADGEPSHPPVRFLSIKDSLDSASAAWDLQVAVLGALAKGERDAIKARIKSHRLEVRETVDRVHGGSRPAWVMTAPREGGGTTWVPDPAKAPHVRWAADHIIGGGSLTSIAHEWTRRGWESKGSAWSATTVRRILKSPALYGVVTVGGVRRDAEGVIVRNPALALMTHAHWQRLQAALQARSIHRSPVDGPRSPALLAGLLVCETCDRVMYWHAPTDRTPQYRCRGGVECPRRASVVASFAHDVVTRFVLDLVGGLVIMPERVSVESVDSADLAAVEEAHSAVQARLMSGNATAEDLASFNTLTARLTTLRDRVAAAEAASQALASADMRTIRQRYEDATTDAERREVLAAGLPNKIIVHRPPSVRDRTNPAKRFSLPDAGEYAREIWESLAYEYVGAA